LIEHKLFENIDMRELLKNSWNKPERKKFAANIITFIEHFEKVTVKRPSQRLTNTCSSTAPCRRTSYGRRTHASAPSPLAIGLKWLR
jgi:hypothetical protein